MTLLKTRLELLAVFHELKADPVIRLLMEYLADATPSRYAAFVSCLYDANGGDLGAYVKQACENSQNPYVRRVGQGKEVASCLAQSLASELDTLQQLADVTPARLGALMETPAVLPEFVSGGVDIPGAYRDRIANIGKQGYGLFARYSAFTMGDDGQLLPVKHPDPTRLSDLFGYRTQRDKLLGNTRAFLAGKPAANALLTGDAGTGKSVTVKAIVNELFPEGLRIVEVRKDQMRMIGNLMNELSEYPLKFIVFIDDLSFTENDDAFSGLKAILEGSVTARPHNILIYATSNRRHVVKETFSDREEDEIHRNDTIQETVSLSERFGLQITYGKPDKKTYLEIVTHLCGKAGIEVTDQVMLEAERFALGKCGRSARTAAQFVDQLQS